MKKGFTLIELLVVIGVIAILAVIVLVAVNPARQFAQARNAQRTSDVTTVLNAIHQQAVDNNGTINAAITADCTPAQAIDNAAGGAGADLSSLSPTYVSALPTDPTGAAGSDTGYDVCVLNGRVTVSAPAAELGATVTVTR